MSFAVGLSRIAMTWGLRRLAGNRATLTPAWVVWYTILPVMGPKDPEHFKVPVRLIKWPLS